jgi:hypothetical protein
MKHTWKAALAVAAVAMIGTAGAARADLTLDGQTGLFSNPTAEIVQKGAPEISGNYIHYSDSGYHENSYGIHGAIQAADKLELSAGYQHYSDNEDYSENDWHIGGKYQLLSQQEKGFDLAVGADYLRYNGDYDNDGNYYTAYLAATKAFTNGNRAAVKGTLGLRWDKDDPNDFPSSSKASVYAGVEVPVTRTGQVRLIGELGSKRYDDSDAVWDIGVRYHPQGSGLSLGAGFGNPWGWEDGTTWFAQVGYTFGK